MPSSTVDALWAVASAPRRGRPFLAEWIHHCHRAGVESLSVVNLCCFFIGLVLALQTAVALARYGAEEQVTALVCVSFVRELGPVFAAVMFAGRVGTSISAELASMRASDQVDAWRAFGADPVARLVAPRVWATIAMLPVLTVVGCGVGVTSGYLVGLSEGMASPRLFAAQVADALSPLDLGVCVIKSIVFGGVIGAIAAERGLGGPGGSAGVGRAATDTMVRSVIAILALDVFLTKALLLWEAS